MREVEVKARIRSETALLKLLKRKGITLGDAVKQRDQVFGLPGVPGSDENNNWLRLRTENGKKFFTLKRSVVGQLDCTEHESVVQNPKELLAIIT